MAYIEVGIRSPRSGSVHKDNFKIWFTDILQELYKNTDAGFVILLVIFPLLERYLRQKTKLISPNDHLDKNFYNELCYIFKALKDSTTAKDFWNVYRNGSLHQVTLAKENQKGKKMPVGVLSDQVDVAVEASGKFWICPILFSERVLEAIGSDFETYEGDSNSSTCLPNVKTVNFGQGSRLGTVAE